MAVRYFNKAIVRGRVTEAKFRTTKTNKRPYADLKVICPSDKFGDVMAFCRLWGKDRREAFKQAYKANPEQAFRLTGQLQQYEKEGRALTAFNVFGFEEFHPTADDRPRASFILKGELMEKSYPDDEESLTILCLKVGRNNGEGEAETFRIHAPAMAAEGLPIGKLVQLNGHLRDMDAEFGGSGNQRPVAEVLKVVG